MKKQVKRLLSVGLCLALGLSVGGGLAACKDSGEGTPTVDWNAGTWSKPEASYWIAGTLNGYENTLANDGWGEDLGEESVPAERCFEQNSENDKLWRLVINLYKDEEFKIRFGALGWDEENGKSKLSADTNLDKSVADDKNGIYDATGGMGGSNFKVAADGQYEVRIDATGAPSVVTYVRKGDAPKLSVKVTEVQLSSTTLTLTAGGDTATLTATVLPEDAVDKEVTWRSLNSPVATVDENGVVTPVAKGTTIIVATAGGVEAECAVTVVEAGTTIVDVTSVTLNKKKVELHAGDTETLTATVAPDNATNKTVVWSVGATDKAATVVDGVITAVKPGTATVTATAGDKTDTCEVTVLADYYLAGASRSPAFEGKSWAAIDKVSEIPDGILFVQDAEDENKYTLELDLYADDEFAILSAGLGWDGKIAGGTGAPAIGAVTEVTNIPLAGIGGGSNLKVSASGKYVFTLTFADGVPSLSFNRVGDAEELAWSYHIYAHGNWDPTKVDDEGNKVWEMSPRIGSTVLDKDNLTLTGTIEIGVGAEFGLITSDAAGAKPVQIGWGGKDKMTLAAGVTGIDLSGGNAKCTAAGTYTVKITLNENGGFVSIEFTDYQAPAAA